MRSENILPHFFNQRPDTKWNFYCVTNVNFFLFLLSGVPLGCIEQPIPSALLRNPFVMCFVSDCEMKPYLDDVCIFCALAYVLNGGVDLQHNTEN